MTTVAPTGVDARMEISSPATAQTTEITPAQQIIKNVNEVLCNLMGSSETAALPKAPEKR